MALEEMGSRGYLPPLRERVDDALKRDLTSDSIMLRSGRYVKKARPKRADLRRIISSFS